MSGSPPPAQAGAGRRIAAAASGEAASSALRPSLAGAALALVISLVLTSLLLADEKPSTAAMATSVATSLMFAALTAYAIHSRLSTIAVFRAQELRLQSALAKAEASEARARAVIDHAQDGIITIDERGSIQTFNSAAARIFGYTEAEVLGRNVGLLMHAADAGAHDARIANFLRTGTARIIGIGREVTGRHKDGRDIPLELGVTELAVDGRRFFCGILRDVSERKAAEQALRDSQRKLQSYIDQSLDGVLVVDEEGRYLEANPAACALLGYDEAELLRLSIRETLFPDEDNRRAGAAHFGRVVETGRSVGEVALRRKDGARIVADINAVALGRGRYLGLLRDVTERFHAERLLQQERQLLESRVAERTAVLTRTNLALEQEVAERARVERELRAARELAVKAAEAKAGFLANMSHELRTPMNAVIGTAALLQDTELTAEQRNYVDMICASGDLLLAIINDILDISKIESGMLHLEVRPLEIGHVVEEAFDLLAARAADKGLDVGYAIADDVPDRVLGDATRLRQILVNLLSNAVKFTDRGEVWIAVAMQPRVDGPPLLQVSVRDTGIGMPSDRASWLFRPFTQADTSTTRKYGGTGLGLAICARLVHMMGGEIRAESEEGRGSTFVFTLPATSVAARGPLRYPRTVVPGLRGRRALLVTDNAVGLHSIDAPCRRWGLDVVPADSVDDAAAAIAARPAFDVVIVDEAGHGIATQVAGLVGDRVPLVVLTRSAASPPSGVGRRLARPVKHSALLRVVLESLGLDAAGEAVGSAADQHGAELARRLPLHILVAEDSRMNQKVIALILARLGYACEFAENGQEVLDRLAARQFDLVFMDLQMPVMDGLEAARRIVAEHPAATRPHIVAMTAVALAGDRERCLAAGMDDYIAKPVLPASVRQAIERCGNRAASPPSQQSPAAAIDMRTIAELRALDDADQPSLLRTLVAEYLAEAPRHVDELRATVGARDAAALAARAHKLAGMSLAIGAVEVARASVRIERLASHGEAQEAAAHVDEVAAALAAARTELNRLLGL